MTVSGDQAISGLGHFEVFMRDPASIVGRNRQRDLVVADQDIGVVLNLLSVLSDPVHEPDRLVEILKQECPLNLPVEFCPFGVLIELLGDLVFA